MLSEAKHLCSLQAELLTNNKTAEILRPGKSGLRMTRSCGLAMNATKRDNEGGRYTSGSSGTPSFDKR